MTTELPVWRAIYDKVTGELVSYGTEIAAEIAEHLGVQVLVQKPGPGEVWDTVSLTFTAPVPPMLADHIPQVDETVADVLTNGGGGVGGAVTEPPTPAVEETPPAVEESAPVEETPPAVETPAPVEESAPVEETLTGDPQPAPETTASETESSQETVTSGTP